MLDLYCVKCKKKKHVDIEFKDMEFLTKKGKKVNRRLAMGKCPDCGCKMARFVKKE